MGDFSRRRRPAEPEPGTHLSKSAADSTTAAGAADDAVSRTRSDTAASSVAAAQSSTLNRQRMDGTSQGACCTMSLSYWERVAVGWRILWQGIGGFFLAVILGNLAIFSVLPEIDRMEPSYWALALPLLSASALSLFVLLPLVVRGLIAGPFGTFRLVVKRDESCRSTA